MSIVPTLTTATALAVTLKNTTKTRKPERDKHSSLFRNDEEESLQHDMYYKTFTAVFISLS